MQNNNPKTKYIKKIIAVLLILSMSFSLICGCSNKNSKVSKSGFYFDTIINIFIPCTIFSLLELLLSFRKA